MANCEKLNINFLESYKELDNYCKGLRSTDDGVTSYINDMRATPKKQRKKVENWYTVYNNLLHVREMRNKLAHDENVSFTEKFCTQNDIDIIDEFTLCLQNKRDPISLLRSSSQSYNKKTSSGNDNETVKNEIYDDTFLGKVKLFFKSFNIKNYKFSLNFGAILLFALLMLPNILWLFLSPENDALKQKSITPVIDIFAIVFQVVTLGMLCFSKNTVYGKVKISKLFFVSFFFLILYLSFWGINTLPTRITSIRKFIYLCLAIYPCLAIFFYTLDRKNYISLLPLIIFTSLHLTSTIINFL